MCANPYNDMNNSNNENAAEYLANVVKKYAINNTSSEATQVQAARKRVEETIRAKFGNVPHIRYGGSYMKGTMVRTSYDLDILCYLPRDANDAGETLEEIFKNVQAALEEDYHVYPKRTALRLAEKEGGTLHIDVVPGRFVDESETTVFLHQNEGDKSYLQTDPDVHKEHVAGSSVRDAIRLVKVWRDHMALNAKTFALELLVIKLLQDHKSESLDKQFERVLTAFRDQSDTLAIKDPANGKNDLHPLLDEMRGGLAIAAEQTLAQVEQGGWVTVFGPVEDVVNQDYAKRVQSAVAADPTRVKPWAA